MSEGAEIRQLDEDTVQRIAAGEVVERPASVVKELVENSLDAGASRVEVEVERGGIDGIRVRDDGAGISAESLQLAVEEHTTSKIDDIDDLEAGVGTLGFRGEALHTIGAVARLTLRSKPENASGPGHEVIVEGGETGEVNPVGCPTGTTVEVDNLFYNTPARRKFLKTDATEFDQVNTVVTQYALANPEVAVSLTHDGRETFATEGTGDLRSAVLAVYGREVAEAMIEVETEPEGPVDQVRGMVSHPETTRAGREYLATFVNDRYVTASVLREAVVDAYGSQLAADRYPFAVLFVDVPAEGVDVNVHPRKMEVRFGAESEVQTAVQSAVSDALLDHGVIRSTAPRGRSAPDQADVSPGDSDSSSAQKLNSRENTGDGSDAREETGARPRDADSSAAESGTITETGATDTETNVDANARADTADHGTDRQDDGRESLEREVLDVDPTATGVETVDPEDEHAWSVDGIGGGDHNAPTTQNADGTDDSSAATDTGSLSSADKPEPPESIQENAGGSTSGPGFEQASSLSEDVDVISSSDIEADTSIDRGEEKPESQASTTRVQTATDQGTLAGGVTASERDFDRLPSLRVLGQLHDTYVIAEAPNGLVLIDQHAADERVAYEQLSKQFADGTTSQTLAEPIEIELTAREAALFDEYIEALESLGFQATRAGDRAVEVAAVPAVFDTTLDPELLRDALSAFVRDGDDAPQTVEAAADELLSDLACYPAITGNTSLTEGSVVELLETLDSCENPYACPHGRPVVIEFDQDELDTRFERDYPGHAGRRR
jgi:DNA mismatch repair protein MutL